MLDVALYSLMGLASALAPNLTAFLIMRALFGVAMGGEWGIGASLTMESVNPEARGLVSGLLQSGYPTGYLLASVVFALLYDQCRLARHVRHRLPARRCWCCTSAGTCPESPAWQAERARPAPILQTLGQHWQLALYAIAADDGVQFLQPWHPGPLSDLPAATASLRCAHHRLDRHRLQHRRHSGRLDLRHRGASASGGGAP